jgi:hypothetical protein
MGSDERITSAARVWLAEDGILHVSSLGVESTEDSVRELQAAKLDLVGKARVPMLFHGENWPRGTPRSWGKFVSIIESMSYAVAVVISPMSLKAMGAFPQLLDDLLIPFRVFESEEPALAFLRQHLND